MFPNSTRIQNLILWGTLSFQFPTKIVHITLVQWVTSLTVTLIFQSMYLTKLLIVSIIRMCPFLPDMGVSSQLFIPIPPLQSLDIPDINRSLPTWSADICICCFFCLSSISSSFWSVGFYFQYWSVYSVSHTVFLGPLAARWSILCWGPTLRTLILSI